MPLGSRGDRENLIGQTVAAILHNWEGRCTDVVYRLSTTGNVAFKVLREKTPRDKNRHTRFLEPIRTAGPPPRFATIATGEDSELRS